MADYVTQADLESRFGFQELVRLTDDDGVGSPDSDSVQDAIDDAEGTIDSYLEQKYSTPLSEVPQVIENAAADLAFYQLQQARQSVSDDMSERKNDILNWLQDIVNGNAGLGSATEFEESSGAGGVEFEADNRSFGRDKPL